MKEWKAGNFDMLIQETVRTSLGLLSDIRQGQSDEQISKTFTRMVLQGKIRQAVRFATERGMGGGFEARRRSIKQGWDEFNGA